VNESEGTKNTLQETFQAMVVADSSKGCGEEKGGGRL